MTELKAVTFARNLLKEGMTEIEHLAVIGLVYYGFQQTGNLLLAMYLLIFTSLLFVAEILPSLVRIWRDRKVAPVTAMLLLARDLTTYVIGIYLITIFADLNR